MSERQVGLVKVQARKVQRIKGRKEPSSYMVTIPKEAVDSLKVRDRKEKVQVLLNEESRRLVYQF